MRTPISVAVVLGLLAACASSSDTSNGTAPKSTTTPDASGGSTTSSGSSTSSTSGSSSSSGSDKEDSGTSGTSGDSGTSSDSGVSIAAAITTFEGWLAAYEKGGTIDYENDGTIDVTITANPDGSRDIVIPGTHGNRVTMHRVSATDLSENSDANDDGVMDRTWTVSKSGTTVTSLETVDTDFDGTPDRRTTVTRDTGHTGITIEQFMYAYDGSGQAWTITDSYEDDGPATATGCAPNPKKTAARKTGQPAGGTPGLCEGYCNYNCTIPTLSTTFNPIAGSPHLYFVATGPSACDEDHRDTISKALEGLPEAYRRLKKINPTKLNRLNAALMGTKVRYGCGAIPACLGGGVVAATVEDDPGEETRGTGFKTVFRMGAGQAIDEPTESVRVDAVAELVFHELFHLYKPHDYGDSNGNKARDDIYSCSRYMASWKSGDKYYLGIKDDASSSRDAATCADDDHKGDFGYGQAHLSYDHLFYETEPSVEAKQMLCRVDQAPVDYATCGLEKIWTYCDQTPIPGAKRTAAQVNVFECATVCPAGTTSAAPCAPSQVPDERGKRVGGCTKIAPSTDY